MPDLKKKNDDKCSFCGKTRNAVEELFDGPGGRVRICDQCVAVCNLMMAEKKMASQDFNDSNAVKVNSNNPASQSKKVYSDINFLDAVKPKDLKEDLDQYVIGQARAKKVVSV